LNAAYMLAECSESCAKVEMEGGYEPEYPQHCGMLDRRLCAAYQKKSATHAYGPSCSVWAQNGECERNPLMMLEQCASECHKAANRLLLAPRLRCGTRVLVMTHPAAARRPRPSADRGSRSTRVRSGLVRHPSLPFAMRPATASCSCRSIARAKSMQRGCCLPELVSSCTRSQVSVGEPGSLLSEVLLRTVASEVQEYMQALSFSTRSQTFSISGHAPASIWAMGSHQP